MKAKNTLKGAHYLQVPYDEIANFRKKPNKSHVSLLQITLKIRWTIKFGRAGLFLGEKYTRKISQT